jgi:hypothetical protein
MRMVLGVVAMLGALAMARAQSTTGPNPEDDPNFPGLNGRVTVVVQGTPGGDLTWSKHSGVVLDWRQAGDPRFAGNIPTVTLPPLRSGAPSAEADYLGFVDGEGAYLLGYGGAGIYVFDGSAHTLTRKFDKLDDIPEDVLAALRNRKYLYLSSRDALNVMDDEVAEANSTAPPDAAKPYEPDPNLAGAAQDNSPLMWNANRTGFTIRLPQAQPVPGMYLGFNEQGSWVASGAGTVYVWNLASKTLVETADSWWDAPPDLKNASALLQAVIYYRQHEYRAAAMRSQAQDPNLPPTMAEFSRLFLAMQWRYQGADLSRPLVNLLGTGEFDRYLGFDERGTWVLSGYGGVYAWSFKTWTLERVARDLKHVPKEALLRLHNPDPMVTGAAMGQ